MLAESLRASLDKLSAAGWEIELYPAAEAVPLPIVGRYANVPEDYKVFLSLVSSCVSPEGKDWFVTLPEFAGTTDSDYAWNEWEKMSLDSFEGNEEWQAGTKAFWDVHIPVFLSVASGYSYVAYDLTTENYGKIVHSRDPFWEEPTTVADSFVAFLQDLGERASGRTPLRQRPRMTTEDKQKLRELLVDCFVIPEEPGDVKITSHFLEMLEESGVITDRCELIDGVIIKKEPRITIGEYRTFIQQNPPPVERK